MTGRAALLRDLLIAACAVSAGIHAALVPAHLAEGATAGAAFAAAALLLAALAVALTRSPEPAVVACAAATFGGLLATYGLAVTTGLPVLHSAPEAVDGLALGTKAIELAGLAAAAHLLRQRGALT